MPLVTGTLSDFGLSSLTQYQPVIVFMPSGVGFMGGRVLATRPIRVTPDAGGYFQVDLASTDTIEPAVWYGIQIQWLEPGGGYSYIDFEQSKLYVPTLGGNLPVLIDTPSTNQLMVIWQDTEPIPWPLGVVWANTITGDVRRKDS